MVSRLAAVACCLFAAVLLTSSGCGWLKSEPAEAEKPSPPSQPDSGERSPFIYASTPNPSASDIARLRAPLNRQDDQVPAVPPVPLYSEMSVRETAVDALGRIGPAAVPALIETLTNSSDNELRADAAAGLARLGPAAKDAVPALTQALSDPDDNVRENAARALGQIGPDAASAVPALIEVLREEDKSSTASFQAP